MVISVTHSVLYPQLLLHEANPKAISKRTRYFQVWLVFHPYPQLIRAVFNPQRFGPSHTFTYASSWPWIDHLVSGLIHRTFALFTLGFPSAPSHWDLTLPCKLTRRLIMQKARRHPFREQALSIGLRLLVGIRFQVLFHSPSGVLFIFHSRYLFTIGHQWVFSLGGWTLRIHTRFHVTGTTREIIIAKYFFRLQGYHLLWLTFPGYSTKNISTICVLNNTMIIPTTP